MDDTEVYGCPESVSGHDNGDRNGNCTWCGKRVNSAIRRPEKFEVSDLTEAYETHYNPDDWEATEAYRSRKWRQR
jgi:hypothetical protein